MMPVLRTAAVRGTIRGFGVFLDVVYDLDTPGLLEHQRSVHLLAGLEWLLVAEQQDTIRAGLELNGLAGLDLKTVR
jgi:hypothetical protein